jgi:phosphate transport system substrate-binding protein
VPTQAPNHSEERSLSLTPAWVRTPATLAFAGMLLLLAACGGGSSASPSGDAGLAGEIVISGSSTVEPISSIVASDFNAANPNVDYSVDGPGTGDGMALLCDGSIDIADASRAIEDEEAAICEENGINFIELQIGIDGISVITSPENTDVTCLSFADLYALTGPESQGFDTWDAANALADEIGSGDFGEVHTPFPSKPLDITAPGEESGTYDTYVGFVVAGLAEERGADEATRPDYTASADDNVIIENIGGSASSLGFVGFAFADQNADSVKTLEVDAGDGCIAPDPDTIASGEYPLSRDLYIYVNTARADSNHTVAEFVDWFLSDGIGAVTEADYIALDDATLAETVSTWEGR